MAGIIYFEIYYEKAISLSCWTFHIVNTYLLDNFKQIIEIQQESPSAKETRKRKKRPFNCWSYKTEFEVRSSLKKGKLKKGKVKKKGIIRVWRQSEAARLARRPNP